MKSIFILLVSILFVVFTANILIAENEYTATANEELFGIWINMDYQESTKTRSPQKYILKLGEGELYASVNDTEPLWTEEISISHKWTDAEGNIWYKYRWNAGLIGSNFVLSKISESGKTFEYTMSQWEYPKAIDHNHDTYRIYFRH